MIGIDMKMPENCSDCKIENFGIKGYTCQVTGKITTGVREAVRQKDCPLVEIQDTKADPDKLEVGDEVINNGDYGVVTWIGDDVRVMWSDGSSGCWRKEDLKRTGQYYVEILAVLEKLKVAANE